MEHVLKALSVRQPWAWAILHGGKDIENRSWDTMLRGTVALHAARTAETSAFFNFIRDRNLLPKIALEEGAVDNLPKGAVIGLVDVIDCVSASPSKWWEGPKGFVLANPRPLIPIPCRGAMQFFDLPPTVIEAIEQQLGSSP